MACDPGHDPRSQLVKGQVETDAAGVRRVRPAHRRGSASHMVSALALADALAAVPAESTVVEPGDVLLTRSLA